VDHCNYCAAADSQHIHSQYFSKERIAVNGVGIKYQQDCCSVVVICQTVKILNELDSYLHESEYQSLS